MSETPTAGDTGDEVRDEVRLDLDEEKLDTWEDVRGDYATDPESEVARPALSESGSDDAEDVPVREEGPAEDDEPRDGQTSSGPDPD